MHWTKSIAFKWCYARTLLWMRYEKDLNMPDRKEGICFGWRKLSVAVGLPTALMLAPKLSLGRGLASSHSDVTGLWTIIWELLLWVPFKVHNSVKLLFQSWVMSYVYFRVEGNSILVFCSQIDKRTFPRRYCLHLHLSCPLDLCAASSNI